MADNSPLRRDRIGLYALGLGALILTAASAGGLEAATVSEATLRGALRISGRVAFVVWWITFIASPVHALARGRLSRLLMRHRREMGLFFAGMQAGHAVLIARLFLYAPATKIPPGVLV